MCPFGLLMGGKIPTLADVCDRRVSIEQVLPCTCTGSLVVTGQKQLLY